MASTRDKCPGSDLLQVIAGTWTNEMIYHLSTAEEMRFGALKRALGTISPKVLTERLRHLEAHGIVFRVYEPTIPPTVSYGLTPLGRDIANAIGGLTDVAVKWKFQRNEETR